MIIHCATTNPGKLREFGMAAEHWGFSEILIDSLPGLGSMEAPEEHGVTFEENATAKAVYYSGHTGELVFADDSGLEVDALGGAPGVYSARFAGPEATDVDNNRLLLKRLIGEADRTARFVCVCALARQGELLGVFRGSVEGRIIDEARGANGFGYDPLFFYPPFDCTFGEAGGERKMDVSHRGQALLGLLRWCRESLSSGNSRRSS